MRTLGRLDPSVPLHSTQGKTGVSTQHNPCCEGAGWGPVPRGHTLQTQRVGRAVTCDGQEPAGLLGRQVGAKRRGRDLLKDGAQRLMGILIFSAEHHLRDRVSQLSVFAQRSAQSAGSAEGHQVPPPHGAAALGAPENNDGRGLTKIEKP